MIWLPLPLPAELLKGGYYQVLTEHGVELGLHYPGGHWLDNGGAPIRPTHYATIADVLAATNAPTKEMP